MSWNKERSKERVNEELKKNFSPKITDHGREMDFTNLGLEDVRRVQGVHVYADIPNFNQAVAEAGGDKQKQKKLLRKASVLRKMQKDLIDDEGAQPLQLQGARLHFLTYRPYGEEAERVLSAVISAITLQSYLYGPFNDVFDDGHQYTSAIGLASGETLIANIGHRGDRELISLGSAANLGAKVLGAEGSMTVTEEIYELLPEKLRAHFGAGQEVCGTKIYVAEGLTWENHADLQDDLGVSYDPERLRERTKKYRDELPLDEIEISDAEVLIDIEALTERNCKRTHTLTIFADLSGFTARIQDAEDDEKVASEIKHLHVIRQEFHRVIEQDFPGIAVQHQGDCVVAIIHLPAAADEAAKRCKKAILCATAIQSSMEKILVDALQLGDTIHVAIGVDEGDVLITRLGKKGDREVICLGNSVEEARELQERAAEKEIRISKNLYLAIDDEGIQSCFYKEKDGSYVGKSLFYDDVAKSSDRSAAEKGILAAMHGAARGTVLVKVKDPSPDRPVHKPHLSAGPLAKPIAEHWYLKNPGRLEVEKTIASQRLDSPEFGQDEVGRQFIKGALAVSSDSGADYGRYLIKIVYPTIFPEKKSVPATHLLTRPWFWKNVPDSHIEADWKLCLFVAGVSGIDFTKENSLDGLIDVTALFLMKETFFQEALRDEPITKKKARWVGAEYDHGDLGYRQAYRDMKGKIGRNDPCICGSGKKAKHCHYEEIRRNS